MKLEEYRKGDQVEVEIIGESIRGEVSNHIGGSPFILVVDSKEIDKKKIYVLNPKCIRRVDVY